MESLLLLLLGTLAGFAGGAVYGSLRSIKVGEVVYKIIFAWERLVDKFHKVPRSVRRKLARAKRLGQEIDEKYLR